MSQGQPRRPLQEPVKYGDVFQVSGDLSSQPVAPKDAAAAQAAESIAFGRVQKGGPAAVMQSAADVNLSRGVVGRDDVTEAAIEHGVSISETDVGGQHIVTEAVGGEVFLFVYPTPNLIINRVNCELSFFHFSHVP